MNFQNYIIDVLLFRKKVYFPGLGTLKIVRSEASVKGGKFFPPKSFLSFSRDETIPEDDHLASKIAEGEEIGTNEANQRILEYIDDIKFALNKEEDFTIPGVCRLRMDENNNIRVIEDPEFVAAPDEFGLESFELEGFEEESRGEEESQVPEAPEKGDKKERIELALDVEQDMHKFEEAYISSGQKTVAQKVGPSVPPPPPPDPPKRDYYSQSGGSGRSGRNAIWIISGSIVVILAAIILVPLKTSLFNDSISFEDIFTGSEKTREADQAPSVEDQEFDFDNMVDNMEKDLDSSTEMGNALNPAEPEISESDETASTESSAYVEYHIIAGSFRDLENARDLQKQLTLLGYPSLIIEPGSGIYRVSAISFKNKVTALNELVKFREDTGLTTAWLMNLE